MTKPKEFKSPLDKTLHEHGSRYGFLVYFARAVIDMEGDCALRHIPIWSPYFHNHDGKGVLRYDEACVRCNLDEALNHCHRKGWVGLEWTAKPKKTRKAGIVKGKP